MTLFFMSLHFYVSIKLFYSHFCAIYNQYSVSIPWTYGSGSGRLKIDTDSDPQPCLEHLKVQCHEIFIFRFFIKNQFLLVLSTSTRTLVLPGTAPKGAIAPTPDILPAIIPGRLTAAEEDTQEAVVMAEAEATAENAAAATSWEGSPAEVGDCLGTAGRAVPHSTWKPFLASAHCSPNYCPIYSYCK